MYDPVKHLLEKYPAKDNGYCAKCGKDIVKDYPNRRLCFSCVRSNALECYKKRDKMRYTTNPEKMKKKSREGGIRTRKKERANAISHYGDKCVCCGETIFEFLSIDHINGGGSKHRKELKLQGTNFYRWLRDNNYPSGYRVLCYNCNLSLGFNGYCPHNKNEVR